MKGQQSTEDVIGIRTHDIWRRLQMLGLGSRIGSRLILFSWEAVMLISAKDPVLLH